MSHIRQHWYCTQAPLRQVKSRGKVKLLRPMGNVKTIYYREGKLWLRAGVLCLHCLRFEPDKKFLDRQSLQPLDNNRRK